MIKQKQAVKQKHLLKFPTEYSIDSIMSYLRNKQKYLPNDAPDDNTPAAESGSEETIKISNLLSRHTSLRQNPKLSLKAVTLFNRIHDKGKGIIQV